MTDRMPHLQQLAQAGELLFSGEVPKQYAAICYRHDIASEDVVMLLVTGRKSGKWILPRGWPMEGRSPREVAEREAFEEAGVAGKARKKSVGCYTYPKRFDDGRIVPCLVEVFGVRVDKIAKNYKEKGQRQRKWVSFTEAQNLVEEPELRSLIIAFGQTLQTTR